MYKFKTNNETNKAISSEDKKKKTIGRNEYNDNVILFQKGEIYYEKFMASLFRFN